MASKDHLDLISNPFIKPQNRTWELDGTTAGNGSFPSRKSVHRELAPPHEGLVESSSTLKTPDALANNGIEIQHENGNGKIASRHVESGQMKVEDPVAIFADLLAKHARAEVEGPILSVPDTLELYRRNLNPNGHHFVVHQHDHPVAGVHYDLRLQINETSSISFAIMYGLPGHPNSKRLNRNATETRVHNLWVSAFLLFTRVCSEADRQ